MSKLSQSDFNDVLKRMSKVYLKNLIPSIGLKFKHEKVLWLIYVDELTYAEAASELNMTKESVGNLVCKARKEFKYLVDKQNTLLPESIKNCLDIFNND